LAGRDSLDLGVSAAVKASHAANPATLASNNTDTARGRKRPRCEIDGMKSTPKEPGCNRQDAKNAKRRREKKEKEKSLKRDSRFLLSFSFFSWSSWRLGGLSHFITCTGQTVSLF
jgi:hypothetical protein